MKRRSFFGALASVIAAPVAAKAVEKLPEPVDLKPLSKFVPLYTPPKDEPDARPVLYTSSDDMCSVSVTVNLRGHKWPGE